MDHQLKQGETEVLIVQFILKQEEMEVHYSIVYAGHQLKQREMEVHYSTVYTGH